MQQVVDELAIRNLLARLAHVSDWGSVEECEACYTPDASWSMPASPAVGLPASELVGRADIVDGIQQRRAAGVQGPGSRSRHMITTVHVSLSGADDAVVDSCWLFVDESQTPPVVRSSGRYRDTVRREDGAWRLAERRIVLDS